MCVDARAALPQHAANERCSQIVAVESLMKGCRNERIVDWGKESLCQQFDKLCIVNSFTRQLYTFFFATPQRLTMEFLVKGMSCASCAANIEKTLLATPGVAAASVNFSMSSATVTACAGPLAATPATVLDVIRGLGFTATQMGTTARHPPSRATSAKIELLIHGMSCASCANKIEVALRSVAGVESANVNFSMSNATLTLIPGSSNPSVAAASIAVIESLGFSAEKLSGSRGQPSTGGGGSTRRIECLVSGMSCASCANSIEKALLQAPGVAAATVNFSMSSAAVTPTADASSITPSAVLAIIRDLGFSADLIAGAVSLSPPKPLEFVITGMSCASCAGKIEAALSAMTGVQSASVNFSMSTATVTVVERGPSSSPPSADAIMTVIRGLGYTVDRIGNQAEGDGGATVSMNHGTGLDDDDDARGDSAEGDEDGGDTARIRQALSRDDELQALKSRTIVSCIAAVVLMFDMIASMYSPPHSPLMMFFMHRVYMSLTVGTILDAAIATPIVIFCGFPFFKKAFIALKNKSATMDTLIAVAVGGSYSFSLVAVIQLLSAPDCRAECYFDTAAMLLAFMLLGKTLEAVAKRRTGGALLALLDLTPPTCTVVRPDGTSREIKSARLRAGHVVRVIPAVRIPGDGTILQGETSIDESMVTGESLPSDKRPGDTVIGGTLNLTTTIHVRIDRAGDDSMLSQILRIVRQAQSSKPSVQRLADSVASVFVPFVICFALLVLLIWLILGYTDSYPSGWREGQSVLDFALAFFFATVVIACPCALGLATPTAIMVSTGVGASLGILIKGGEAIERARAVTAVLCDKTGTLTKGKLSVVAVRSITSPGAVIGGNHNTTDVSAAGMSQAEILELVKTAESESVHPIAKAVVKFVQRLQDEEIAAAAASSPQQRNAASPQTTTPTITLSAMQHVSGAGMQGRCAVTSGKDTSSPRLSNIAFAIGKAKFITEYLTSASGSGDKTSSSSALELKTSAGAASPLAEHFLYITRLQERGNTAVCVAVGDRLVLILAVADTIKDDAAAAVALLANGFDGQAPRRVLMVSGDHQKTALAIAREVGILDERDVFAEQLPTDKARIVEDLQREGHVVAFIGDGTNDSAALAQADVGVALGAGTEVAIDAADVVLVKDNLTDLVAFFSLSQTTLRRIYMNFVWAFGYNLLALPVASGVFFPAIHKRLPPIAAGALMIFSSLSVLSSSLALKCFRLPDLKVNRGTAPSKSRYGRTSVTKSPDTSMRMMTPVNADGIDGQDLRTKATADQTPAIALIEQWPPITPTLARSRSSSTSSETNSLSSGRPRDSSHRRSAADTDTFSSRAVVAERLSLLSSQQ